jgi:hypothetical protein
LLLLLLLVLYCYYYYTIAHSHLVSARLVGTAAAAAARRVENSRWQWRIFYLSLHVSMYQVQYESDGHDDHRADVVVFQPAVPAALLHFLLSSSFFSIYSTTL